MNANDLADKLEQGHWEGGTREQAATMLRQQQAEIANLKAGLLSHHDIYPVKELTDEEIDELAEYHGIDSLYETGRLDFARAILRKAQE